ncbi:MAG: hypothetical protein ACM3ML_38720 [Micromonosporaceae bacterium]
MRMIIYGDFDSPYSYLASQRAGHLARTGTAEADWRAVAGDAGAVGGRSAKPAAEAGQGRQRRPAARVA